VNGEAYFLSIMLCLGNCHLSIQDKLFQIPIANIVSLSIIIIITHLAV